MLLRLLALLFKRKSVVDLPPQKIVLKVSQRGIDLIKQFEGLSLKVYLDAVGLPTVGYGHMDKSMAVGASITQIEADKLLADDLKHFEDGVRFIVDSMPTTVNQNQFDALVSLAFNIGLGAFGQSTLVKKLLKGDITGAGDEFLRWNKAGGKVLAGLVRRREAERKLFLEA